MTENEARARARRNSEDGEPWMVWLDYSGNDRIKASRYADYEAIATLADTKIALYEDGEQTA